MSHCNHTLHAIDATGQTTGSWVIREAGRVRRVECGVCGKFYGRINTEGRKKSSLNPEQAYLEQQRRRACPGCGEEPFLG